MNSTYDYFTYCFNCNKSIHVYSFNIALTGVMVCRRCDSEKLVLMADVEAAVSSTNKTREMRRYAKGTEVNLHESHIGICEGEMITMVDDVPIITATYWGPTDFAQEVFFVQTQKNNVP